MKTFLRFLAAWSELDLTIARSTGANPAHITTLQADVAKWNLALFQEEHA